MRQSTWLFTVFTSFSLFVFESHLNDLDNIHFQVLNGLVLAL